ncbi:hypothetical protein yaldo0001_32290 [Yersinia aldovae ATCC 35236]|nr:hypothetical protein yaldo0001_32290 [Yersinia aldovae ATCC 35236]
MEKHFDLPCNLSSEYKHTFGDVEKIFPITLEVAVVAVIIKNNIVKILIIKFSFIINSFFMR